VTAGLLLAAPHCTALWLSGSSDGGLDCRRFGGSLCEYRCMYSFVNQYRTTTLITGEGERWGEGLYT